MIGREPATATRRRWWRWARPLIGVAILAALVWRVGTGPFLDGISVIDGWSLLAAGGIAVVTTVCCAWRWRLVAHGLGVDVPLRTAIAGYYRSQFLNMTLPGGVLGDVHRGVRHGRDVGDVGRGLRAVAWERSAGQVVQLVLAVLVLLVLPSPVRSTVPIAASVTVAVVLGVVILGRVLPGGSSSRWARIRRAAAADLRDGVLAGAAWPGIAVTSVIVVVGHTATFLLAARIAGVAGGTATLLPLALLVLLAMAVPANVGGWGPREGVAAWAFGAAGLGAALGVTTAVVYGVLVLVASLPGAGVLVADWLRRHTTRPVRSPAPPRPTTAVIPQGVGHG